MTHTDTQPAPHAEYTVKNCRLAQHHPGLPARAGIRLLTTTSIAPLLCLPRAHGDIPWRSMPPMAAIVPAPRARGYTCDVTIAAERPPKAPGPFPRARGARANGTTRAPTENGCISARAGRGSLRPFTYAYNQVYPRARGYTQQGYSLTDIGRPAPPTRGYTIEDPAAPRVASPQPRTRGDTPCADFVNHSRYRLAPRARVYTGGERGAETSCPSPRQRGDTPVMSQPQRWSCAPAPPRREYTYLKCKVCSARCPRPARAGTHPKREQRRLDHEQFTPRTGIHRRCASAKPTWSSPRARGNSSGNSRVRDHSARPFPRTREWSSSPPAPNSAH